MPEAPVTAVASVPPPALDAAKRSPSGPLACCELGLADCTLADASCQSAKVALLIEGVVPAVPPAPSSSQVLPPEAAGVITIGTAARPLGALSVSPPPDEPVIAPPLSRFQDWVEPLE